MASLAEIRQQYPQYADMPDSDLAGALHSKFYSDMPRAEFDKRLGVTAPELPVDPGIDALKSVLPGAAESVIGIADIPEYGARGIDWAVNKVSQAFGGGEVPRPGTQVENFDQRFSDVHNDPAGSDPASKRVQRQVEKVTGEFYQPKTEAGQYAKTFGGFLPAVVGGPGSIATRILTQAAIPAGATEAAGAATRGTAAEGPARIAAALLSGPAAARAVAGRGAAPTAARLREAAGDTYQNPAVTGTPVNPQSAARLADRIEARMHGGGVRPRNMPGLYDDVDELRALGPTPTVADVRSVRQVLSTRAQDKSVSARQESMYAQRAVREIDRYLDNVSPELRDANANYAAGMRSREITRATERADRQAGGANSGQNIDNATRQQIKGILNSDKKSRGFSADERGQMERVVRGTRTGNTARYLGNLLGGGGGMGQLITAGTLGGSGYLAGGNEGAATGLAAAVLGGKGLKGVANASTARQVRILDDMVRSRAPLAQTARRLNIPPQELARMLLQAANPGNQPQR